MDGDGLGVREIAREGIMEKEKKNKETPRLLKRNEQLGEGDVSHSLVSPV
jgi:hypothetical protein